MLQENGYARLVGRMKDVIIRIGDKVFPSEIEGFFEAHPNVMEAQVQSPQSHSLTCCNVQISWGSWLGYSVDEGTPCCGN